MNPTTTIAVQHPSGLSTGDVLGIINSIVQADAPTVIATLPISSTHQATVGLYTGLASLGLGIAAQIAQAIAAAHAAKTVAQ